jgi:predicted PurR-regulated permease PerM
MTEPAPAPAKVPAWLPRAILWFFVGLALFVAAAWLVLRLRALLIMLLVSLVLSFALEPPVNRLERIGIRRSVGTLLVFTGTLLLTAAFGWVIGRLVADQAAELIDSGPRYIESSQNWINNTFNTNLDANQLLDEFQTGGRLDDLATAIAPNIVAVGARVIGLLFQGLTVALFTFYLVADGPRLRRTICSAFPPERQGVILQVWEVAIEKTGGYIYSRVILAFASFVVHSIAFSIIGVPSPIALAVWVAVVSQFIPVIGTYLAGLLPVLIALIDRPVSALWVLIVIVVYQQVENYLLAPRVTAQTMQIHSAVAFGSVIAGAAILGPIGAVLALPVTATITALASTYVQRHEVVTSRLTRTRTRARRRQKGALEAAAEIVSGNEEEDGSMADGAGEPDGTGGGGEPDEPDGTGEPDGTAVPDATAATGAADGTAATTAQPCGGDGPRATAAPLDPRPPEDRDRPGS